jgi:hypothetical protein
VDVRITHQVVVFDAADLSEESAFWAGVLDGTVDAEDDWHMVLVDGEPKVGVQLAPDHVAPDWPDGTPEQQIHLDLWVEDFGQAHDRVMSLGASVLKAAGARGPTRQLPGLRGSGGAPLLPVLDAAGRGAVDTSRGAICFG